MPIDARIPLGAQGATVQTQGLDPIGMMRQVYALRQAKREDAEGQRWTQAQADFQTALEQNEGDIEPAINVLMSRYPVEGLKLRGLHEQYRKALADANESQVKSEQALMGQAVGLFHGVPEGDDMGYQSARHALMGYQLPAKLQQTLDSLLPENNYTEEDKQRIDRATAIVLDAQQAATRQQNALKLFMSGDIQRGMAGMLVNTETPEEVAQVHEFARLNGVPSSLRRMMGAEFTPENKQRWAEMALTADQSVDNQRQQAAQELSERMQTRGQDMAQETAFRGQDMSQQTAIRGQNLTDARARAEGGTGPTTKADERLAESIIKFPGLYAGLTPTAKTRILPLLVEKGFDFKAQTIGDGKPSNGQEKRALNFFNRAKHADEEIDKVAGDIAEMGLMEQGRMKFAPNFLQSQAGQSYIAAQRAFTEARLRKDSGAAIPESEFKNDQQTYFVQPGDTAETIAQKARARASLLASLAFESGRALPEFYGDDAASMVEDYKTKAKTATGGGNTGQPKDGDERPIPTIPGGVAKYNAATGKWTRIK